MTITKETLMTICSILDLPKTGTKISLQSRICSAIQIQQTIPNLIKNNKHDQLTDIAKDIKEMIDDDSSELSIIDYISKNKNTKIDKKDIYFFSEIIDAANKKDYEYIEQQVEIWGTKAKYAIVLAKHYPEYKKNPNLLSVL